METIIFLLLLNLFQKTKIMKEKRFFKPKIINWNYFNLTGLARKIFEIEKKNYGLNNYSFFLKKNEKSINKSRYNNFKFIMKFIKIILDIFRKLLFYFKINYKHTFIFFNTSFQKIFSYLNIYIIQIYTLPIFYLKNISHFFYFIDKNKKYKSHYFY